MKKILTVSLCAMMAVTAANADIASTKYVDVRTGTLTSLTTTDKSNLVAAVNEVKSGLGALAGDGEGSVTEQINSAVSELAEGAVAANTAAIEAINDEATGAVATAKAYADGLDTAMDTRVDKLEAIDHTLYATTANMTTELAKKENASNKVTNFNKDTKNDTTFPTTGAVFTYVDGVIADVNNAAGELGAAVQTNTTAIAAINNTTTGILAQAKSYADTEDAKIESAYAAADTALGGRIDTLSGTVASNKTAADTGIQEAKDAAANALTNAKKYTDDEITSKVTNATTGALKDYSTTAQMTEAIATAKSGAETTAKNYTDGEIDKVETAYAAADATTLSSAKTYADGVAATAKSEAIAAAATDAATKAATAKSEAIAAAKNETTSQVSAAQTALQGNIDKKQNKSTAAYQVGTADGTWAALNANLPTACSAAGTTCSLISKDGNISWEVVKY